MSFNYRNFFTSFCEIPKMSYFLWKFFIKYRKGIKIQLIKCFSYIKYLENYKLLFLVKTNAC